MALIAASSQ
uniref:Uncharacterized protein n=1 Tax=Arundo donax TaxID=35708 RepID=A0A0A9B5I5_ARUDO